MELIRKAFPRAQQDLAGPDCVGGVAESVAALALENDLRGRAERVATGVMVFSLRSVLMGSPVQSRGAVFSVMCVVLESSSPYIAILRSIAVTAVPQRRAASKGRIHRWRRQ